MNLATDKVEPMAICAMNEIRECSNCNIKGLIAKNSRKLKKEEKLR